MVLWVTNRMVYGAHKLWKTARRAGHDLGRDQVARLMPELGIEGISGRRKNAPAEPRPLGWGLLGVDPGFSIACRTHDAVIMFAPQAA